MDIVQILQVSINFAKHNKKILNFRANPPSYVNPPIPNMGVMLHILLNFLEWVSTIFDGTSGHFFVCGRCSRFPWLSASPASGTLEREVEKLSVAQSVQFLNRLMTAVFKRRPEEAWLHSERLPELAPAGSAAPDAVAPATETGACFGRLRAVVDLKECWV